MRNFRELRIWKDSKALALKVYRITSEYPSTEKYGLVVQMRKCAISIPSNIAEGCSRSNRGFVQFLRISLGSAFELETQMELSESLGMTTKSETDELLIELRVLQKRIHKLCIKLSSYV